MAMTIAAAVEGLKLDTLCEFLHPAKFVYIYRQEERYTCHAAQIPDKKQPGRRVIKWVWTV